MNLKHKWKREKKSEKKTKAAPIAGVKAKKTLGALSATSIVLVIIIAVLANVLVTRVNWSYDVTENKIFSLSSQSKKILKNLEDDVTIYFLASKKNVDDSYLQIAEQYEKNSDHVSIGYRDMELYPNFASEYLSGSQTAVEGDVIVVSGDKSRYVSSDDFITYDIDSSGNYTTGINLESCITSAINYVVSDETPIIYTLTGHGEQEFDSSFQSTIESDNYEFKELNLLTEEAVPDDCAILLINAPTSDITAADLKKVRSYMEDGGKLFYVCNVEADSLSRFESLLGTYGVEINDGIVVETDASQYMQGYPTYILPTIESSEITDSLITNSSYILTPVSKGLTVTDDATVLLSTTDDAFSKVNTESNTIEKEDGDIDGPFALAAETVDEEGNPQAVVIGCSNMILSEIDAYVSGANSDFISNCVNSLTQQEDKISIKAKSGDSDTATYTTAAVQMVSFASVIGIPAALLIIGVVVVVVRRRSK
ncbi:MAG TPA: GldG family protein [Candidatus Fimousia stercorigallinarum]|nr:GldG family protein [Candidatus Fimousia stercorigallinarum]